MSKAFTPPLFGKFGKSAKDLFKTQYDFDHQAKFKSKNNEGITTETIVVAPTEGELRGVFKSTIPVTGSGILNGTFESELNTVTSKESKSTYTFNKLAKGLNVKLGLTGIKPQVAGETPDFPEGWANVTGEYAQEYFASSVGVRTNLQKHLVDAEVSIGYDHIAVGGKLTVDTAAKQAPNDYNFGVEFLGSDYRATAQTEKKRSNLSLSYFQNVNKNTEVGLIANLGLVKPVRTLQFGSSHVVDLDTTFRNYVKIDSSKDNAVLGLAVEYQLRPNRVKLNVASEFNVAPGSIAPAKFGVSFTVTD